MSNVLQQSAEKMQSRAKQTLSGTSKEAQDTCQSNIRAYTTTHYNSWINQIK